MSKDERREFKDKDRVDPFLVVPRTTVKFDEV